MTKRNEAEAMVTVAGQRVTFSAALQQMDHGLREEVLARCAAFAAHYGIRSQRPQELIDIYAQTHRERFGEVFRVEGDVR